MRSSSGCRKCALRSNAFVARDAAASDQHDEHAAVGQQKKAHVLDERARKRWRNDDSQAARNGRQHVARAFHHAFGSGRGIEFAANPFAVLGARRGLRGDLFHIKTVRRGRRHASCGRVRLVQQAFVLEVRHDVADCRGTERLGVHAHDGARRHWFARLDVRAHDFGEHLPVAILL